METVAWERWEGTIEYTFMAPLSRAMHLVGTGVFAVLYGLVRAILLFVVVALFFGLHMPDANFAAALALLVIASISFFGIGMMTVGAAADLAREGHAARLRRAGDAARRLRRLLPGLGAAAVDAVALEDLAGDVRAARDPGRDPRRRRDSLWDDIWPLLIIGAVSIPLGLWVFRRGELYAKKHGKLKRSG